MARVDGITCVCRKTSQGINDRQVEYIWKQFNIHKIKLREPPESDIPPEQPTTVNDLLNLHLEEMGYSISDLASMMRIHESEAIRLYSINLPTDDKGDSGHLRIVK
ncbi:MULTISPECIES: hypothetical protein [Rhodoplanes]|uniref:hypothetical protein n=1 Tax=Rhodoplanes TaxID=29407 RepID=UPI00101C57E6|nr:hypothetical protein [Rhodoplanes serenus]